MTDRTAVVAGAGSAVGRATALTFREDGWTVYAAARDEDDVADLADHGIETDVLDVTEGTDVRRVLKRVDAETDRVDCLAFVPRSGGFGPLTGLSPAASRAELDGTAVAFHRLVSRAVPHLRERSGSVVAVSSVLARLSAPGTGGFGAGRAAMAAMADALRTEATGEVTVSLVEPVLVDDGTREAAAAASEPERAASGRNGEADTWAAAEEEPAEAEAEADRWVRSSLSDVAAVSEAGLLGASPAAVGTAVVDVASVSDPPARYPVGRAARLLLYARYLPVRWRTGALSLLRRVA